MTNKLQQLWDSADEIARQSTALPLIDFNELLNSLISIGPYYFYVVDFYDRSLSHVSPSIKEIHGFDPETVTFDAIINAIHPDDMEFVAKAEETNIKFIYDIIGKENVLQYKSNYCFRARLKNGSYSLFNHQAIVLTTDENGGFGKALNIHTDIGHVCKQNSYTTSLIGMKDQPSYTDIKVLFNSNDFTYFSQREIQVLKLISQGYITSQIARQLNISEHTVKTHRKNINKKGDCKNVSELVNKCVSKGLI
ncbi:LuxR C-terminal-related transcriptional regulator [Flavobacterium antarcticum]|uniref:LuxR C-terminal-related transcriptional regulator n=1 Tax=Flavobacterium antarcticum TaxID=271155 RepID=UPI0003B5D6DC|nr:LuxR C-terminal-related transcriptional regulator [Flavobacterium antarcticum]